MRKIKSANITFVSLCPRGKNGMRALFKDDGTVEFQTLSKFDKDKGELLAVVYAPNEPDSDGDYADAAVIKEMAHTHAENGLKLDVRHNGKALTHKQAFVAESFTIAKGDERFADWQDTDGNKVDVTGGWAQLIKIRDAELVKAYGEDGWNGVSLFGDAIVQRVTKSEDDAGFFERFIKAIKSIGHTEEDMDAKDIEAAVAKGNAPVIAGLTELTTVLKAKFMPEAPAAPVVVPAPAGAPTKPEFKGDPLKKEDTDAFEREILAYELKVGLNSTDPQVRAATLAKAKTAQGGAPAAEPAGEESTEVKKARELIAAHEGRSKQPTGVQEPKPASGTTKLTKEQELKAESDAIVACLPASSRKTAAVAK